MSDRKKAKLSMNIHRTMKIIQQLSCISMCVYLGVKSAEAELETGDNINMERLVNYKLSLIMMDCYCFIYKCV